jgi:hypothetical protein
MGGDFNESREIIRCRFQIAMRDACFVRGFQGSSDLAGIIECGIDGSSITKYPGSMDGYQVNFRLPADIAKGSVTIQVNAAWIPSVSVTIPFQ